VIRAAEPRDLEAIQVLLQASDLPFADLTPAHLATFWVSEDDADGVDGAVGLEVFESAALLRSLVVAEGARGQRLGSRLVGVATREASALGVSELFLLTTTAVSFFSGLGFDRVERASAPGDVQSTSEFAALCPDSATCMRCGVGV